MNRDPNLNLTPEQWRASLPHYTISIPIPIEVRLEVDLENFDTAFRRALYTPDENENMWGHLNQLLEVMP